MAMGKDKEAVRKPALEFMTVFVRLSLPMTI
jgi:hypothetical protein